MPRGVYDRKKKPIKVKAHKRASYRRKRIDNQLSLPLKDEQFLVINATPPRGGQRSIFTHFDEVNEYAHWIMKSDPTAKALWIVKLVRKITVEHSVKTEDV